MFSKIIFLYQNNNYDRVEIKHFPQFMREYLKFTVKSGVIHLESYGDKSLNFKCDIGDFIMITADGVCQVKRQAIILQMLNC